MNLKMPINNKMNAQEVVLIFHLFASFVHCENNTVVEDENFGFGDDNEELDSDAFNETAKEWIKDAVVNVAYYLRYHKFNGYDARYFNKRPPIENLSLFGRFVDPPLKNYHFKTYVNCKASFANCLRYLYEIVLDINSQRSFDTIYIMRENNLTMIGDAEKVRNYDKECRKQKDLDDETHDPFDGPIQKFQWSMTASYFMCWFTLMRQPELAHLGEPCDNFANCLEDDESTSNLDIRADDSVPFQCAMYSFCPDPCCTSKRRLLANDSCELSDGNPCRVLNNPKCTFNETLNRSLGSLVQNEWNVSCVCHRDGYIWNSRYGQCVDYNECRHRNPCNNTTEDCVNVNGKFICLCKMGFEWSSMERECVPDDILIDAILRFFEITFDGSHRIGSINLLYLVLVGLCLAKYSANELWLF